MRFGYIRAIAYAAVIFAAAVALTFIPALPDSRPADVMFAQAAVPTWKLRYDTLESGESLQRVLRRGGLSDSAAVAAIQAASSSKLIDERRIPAGLPITVRSETADSAPSEVVLQLDEDHVVRLKRVGADWAGSEEKVAWTTDTIVVAGTIESNLYSAVREAAAPLLPNSASDRLTVEMADEVYAYKIDMSRELQKGDEFKVMAERSVAPSGAVRIGPILATTFSLSGSVLKAVHFASATGSGDYFDDQGKSMRAMFRKMPVDFARISSTFGSRKHPILGYTRAHKGTDYAAAEGTPIKAIGDGVVLSAGWNSGFGNLVQIRHPNGYVTRYGHMHNFAKGIHSGTHVKMGDVIGYVGHTGLATGPHVHFEVLVNGEQRDSRTAFGRSSGAPIPKSEDSAFYVVRDQLLAKLDNIRDSRLAVSLRSLNVAH